MEGLRKTRKAFNHLSGVPAWIRYLLITGQKVNAGDSWAGCINTSVTVTVVVHNNTYKRRYHFR
jgi:hypothetical protein